MERTGLQGQRALFALAIAFTPAFVPAGPAAAPAPPCSGPSRLLGVVDRPTAADSACVVPQGMADIEAGATVGNLYGAAGGEFQSFPNLALRWGLPGNSEVVWLPPSFQRQQVDAGPGAAAGTTRGFGPTTIGVKHELSYTENWLWTAEALVTLPSGDSIYGSHGLGGAVNAILAYGNGPLGVSLMVGATSQTEPAAAGGQRFHSFNPDLVMTWAAASSLQLYGEIYAQSHSGYLQGWGTNADAGLQYLVTPDLVMDLEEGVRIRGNLGGFSNYTGFGFGLMF